MDSRLAQRLGRANTKRRQLLAYYKDHADKISKYIEVALNKAVSACQLPVIPELQSDHQQKPPTISTQWTQDTTVSTVYQDNDVASDSERTKFSETTSTAGDQDQKSIPPPPGGTSVIRRSPFICPYCHQTVQVENDDDWIYHVYSDLRPYICTFGGCVKENQLYDSLQSGAHMSDNSTEENGSAPVAHIHLQKRPFSSITSTINTQTHPMNSDKIWQTSQDLPRWRKNAHFALDLQYPVPAGFSNILLGICSSLPFLFSHEESPMTKNHKRGRKTRMSHDKL